MAAAPFEAADANADANATDTDTGRPHPARVYDWFLGGTHHYPADAEFGSRIVELDATARYGARHNRWFMQRATRQLAGPAGVRQFLDIGSGIPTEPNLHRVAQDLAPEARVVYVDHDPLVRVHAAGLLNGTGAGATAFVEADARDPGLVLERAAEVLDLGRPVALSLVAVTHFLTDDDGAHAIVARLLDALAPGSHLVLSQLSGDQETAWVGEAVDQYTTGGVTLVPRTRAETERFFTGCTLLAPGLVQPPDWRPELGVDETRDGTRVPLYAGVGRKE
ncbi:S-adenosyl methyltransferase [Streptomyces sp. YIM 121038]|uniref:SAM-dependent methyltransferase n=1 Tax=Streptomyces sp. YIM 121038 TaxID=2136401 RepID=UPI00110FFB0B|nr:SAM-dependent methyltransferase [Streptomyces sp. YIM 121038]QCX80327.1 S-adenosyl methyltransferase [Streptomyces sp. YIM 121038]